MKHRSLVARVLMPLLGLLTAAMTAGAQTALDAARDFREANGHRILADLAELVSIPNVYGDDDNIQRNADYIHEAFAKRSVEIEALTVPNASPLLVGELSVPGATRTIGIYVHYDGQPVIAERWTNPPWRAQLYTDEIVRGGERLPWPDAGQPIDPKWRVYARSVSDDKAPLIALLAAIDALRAADIPVTSNIRFLFEGEEEAGSIHLREYFARYGDRLKADVWLICDGPVHQSRRPQIMFGVRGITSFEITVYGANRSLHSGHYGNWSPNPGQLLAQLIGGMKDEQGRVVIEGFYDTVEPLSAEERLSLETVPDVDNQLRQDFGLAESEADNAPLKERLLLPSLNLKGFVCGAVGPASRNVIPSTATASIDIRLVKGNDPEHMLDLVEAHIRRRGFHIIRQEPDDEMRLSHPRLAMVRRGGGYPAARSSMDQPIAAALEQAARRAGNEDVIMLPTLGGSLPLYLFDEMLGTPTIIVPIVNHDNNQHAPDENLRIANLWYGIDLMAEILTME